jgi:hypothetical protein
MGFLTNMISSVTKIALTPVAIAKDAANVATGEDPQSTKSLLKSASEDFHEAIEDLSDGDIF